MDGYEEIDILYCNSMIFRNAGNKCVNVNLVQDLLLPLAMHLGLLEQEDKILNQHL